MERKLITMDGNTAAAHVAYAFTEVAAIYPITPSSVMAELMDQWSAANRKNIFGQTVRIAEMQSEAGAAGAVHGSLTTGALTTTFTASQGLLLMIPNMYKIAGSLLPNVIHVSARAVASHALSIFGDHSDVMACRSTGYAMLCSNHPQECMDLGAVAHLAAIKGHMPFIHFFDGFRTSHEIRKIASWDYKDLADMLDRKALAEFRARALNPDHPVLRGSAQNPDIFFQNKECVNEYYKRLPDIVQSCMDQVNEKIGKNYKLFNYYGAPDAETVMVAMGSMCDCAEEVCDYLNETGQMKAGLIKVRLFRPFATERFLAAIPNTCRYIVAMDRCKEATAIGEPLYMDVSAAVHYSGRNIRVVGGRYGLGSKDTTPGGVLAAYRNACEMDPTYNFTINITDDVTHMSLPITEEPDVSPVGTVCCKFWGLGSDGTVGANKNSIKIIGDHTKLRVQAYFQYDSKKSGGVTISHLRFGQDHIRSSYYVTRADFVACHFPAYLSQYDIVQEIKPGGTLLINCNFDIDHLGRVLPNPAKKYLAENHIKVYTCDAIALAREIGLGNRTNMILQAAFFKLANIIPIDDAVKYMKEAVVKTYGHKGDDIVAMNCAAVDAGLNSLNELVIPAEWANCSDEVEAPAVYTKRQDLKNYVENVLIPSNKMKGDTIPVSKLMPGVDGTVPQGSAAFEKRGIAVEVPVWIPENCIQCNLCSYVCPHSVIRPVVLDKAEREEAPAELVTVPMQGKGCENYQFGIVVSQYDCTSCGSCVNVCPKKALTTQHFLTQRDKQVAFDYAVARVQDKRLPFDPFTVKGSQFHQPLFEFSGACAGCGETPYAKLITQLFGDHMYIANATGCSSIWGGSAPSTPYTVNKKGKGPAWENSLFEDNAEFGMGMVLAVKQRREKAVELAKAMCAADCTQCPSEIRDAAKIWLEERDGDRSTWASNELIRMIRMELEQDSSYAPRDYPLLNEMYEMRDMLEKKTVWILGGDGWAYDIGYGGLDHVLASGENVNVLVFDTEVYSNTGGQASKATPTGAVAQFAAAGKSVRKKDLAQIAMQYGYVYVAQVAMGADYQQTIRALKEAEAYNGPSLVIAYSPCINHGIKAGMGNSMAEMRNAVKAGYWHLFRFNPDLAREGKNPFTLDSKKPSADYLSFIKGEVRYSSLERAFPDRAKALFSQAQEEAQSKYEHLERLNALYSQE